MSDRLILLLALGGTLAACDRSGRDLLPQPNTDFPGVIEVGRLGVMDRDDFGSISPDFCADPADAGCYYGQISSTDGVTKGGATFTFEGTGSRVCVMVDPESVSWNQDIGVSADEWIYPENPSDDGDMDLFGGLSSYYTGSPGIEIGDFTGYYTDSLGRQIEIDYVECYNVSPYLGGEAHAGRGAPEYCTIDGTVEGVEYTIVLETFSVPRDDGLLSFVAAVVDVGCGQLGVTIPSEIATDEGSELAISGVNECSIIGESLNSDNTQSDPCSDELEWAYCANTTSGGVGTLRGFCCANPTACGDDPPEEACVDFDEATFCSEHPALCGCAG